MTPNELFLNQRKQFWAYVRSISQTIGYTVRGQGQIRVPTTNEMAKALSGLGLDATRLSDKKGRATRLGQTLVDYFAYRANVLNTFVEPRLMNKDQAHELFEKVKAAAKYSWPVPMNKQKAGKKAPAYLTGIVNMIVESNIGPFPCNYNPMSLTTVTFDGAPLRTLARRVDGAFPSAVNPIAVWETCDADNGGIKLPPGFCAEVVADGIGEARHIAVAPNGDIYVALLGRSRNTTTRPPLAAESRTAFTRRCLTAWNWKSCA